MKLKFLFAALTLLSAVSFGQPRPCNTNEDLQWIREWTHAEKATELAATLNLSQDQVATLNAVKADVEAIKAEAEAGRAAHEEQVAVTAAEVRANIEATGEFSETDQAALQALRQEGRTAHQDTRAQIAEASSALRDLLTEDQVAAVRAFAQANRGERDDEAGPEGMGARGEGFGPRGEGQGFGPRGEGQGFGPRGEGQGFGPRGGQGGPQGFAANPGRGGRGNHAAHLARILLSDAFLAYYNN